MRRRIVFMGQELQTFQRSARWFQLLRAIRRRYNRRSIASPKRVIADLKSACPAIASSEA
jgi:hypothetical protein